MNNKANENKDLYIYVKLLISFLFFKMKKLNTVLLVDDDNITNFINKRLIQKLDIANQVTAVLNGKEAIDLIKASNEENKPLPELILLDINMPVMDGFEFVKLFRTIQGYRNVIIVMLTTSNNEKDIDKISDSEEISGYINKPLTEQKLQDVFQKYISL